MGAFSVMDYASGILPMACIAHRGFSGCYPENTLLAFKKAIEIGADMIEFDVRVTSDNELVVCHDPSMARLCTRDALVEKLTLKELQKFDLGFGQTIPTVEQLLETCAGQIGMNIHVKVPGDVFDRVIELCGQGRILDQIFLAVEWRDEIIRLRQDYPHVHVCSLFNRTSEDMVRDNQTLDVKILQPATCVLLKGGESFVDAGRQAAMMMHVFFADTYANLRWLNRLGVAGVLTNFPNVFLTSFAVRPMETKRVL